MEHIDQQKNLRRVVISSILGAVIEWYDFFLYGVVAGLFFNQLFFPDFDPRIGTMLAFATFAVGFVARPLGGVIFGHFGDKIGRKKVLILTLEIMGIATVAIGLIPSYATIGIWAPVLLILVPPRTGHRARRRMGRGRAHVLRIRARPQACLLCQPAPDRACRSASCSPPASSASRPCCSPTKPS